MTTKEGINQYLQAMGAKCSALAQVVKGQVGWRSLICNFESLCCKKKGKTRRQRHTYKTLSELIPNKTLGISPVRLLKLKSLQYQGKNRDKQMEQMEVFYQSAFKVELSTGTYSDCKLLYSPISDGILPVINAFLRTLWEKITLDNQCIGE